MADLTNQQLMDNLTDLISVITDNMVTKEDAKQFVTKDDAKQFLTKEDAKRFATKDDLKDFATKQDLERFASKLDLTNMESRLTRKLDSHKRTDIHHHLVVRQEIGQLNQKIDNLSEDLKRNWWGWEDSNHRPRHYQ